MAIGSTTTGYFILNNAAPILGSALGLFGGGSNLIYHIKTEQYEQIPIDIIMMIAGGIEGYYVYRGYSSYISSINNSIVEGTSKTNPLENIKYTDKVKAQMKQGDYHSFPKV